MVNSIHFYPEVYPYSGVSWSFFVSPHDMNNSSFAGDVDFPIAKNNVIPQIIINGWYKPSKMVWFMIVLPTLKDSTTSPRSVMPYDTPKTHHMVIATRIRNLLTLGIAPIHGCTLGRLCRCQHRLFHTWEVHFSPNMCIFYRENDEKRLDFMIT